MCASILPEVLCRESATSGEKKSCAFGCGKPYNCSNKVTKVMVNVSGERHFANHSWLLACLLISCPMEGAGTGELQQSKVCLWRAA